MHNGNKTYTKQMSFFVLFNIFAAQQIMSSLDRKLFFTFYLSV